MTDADRRYQEQNIDGEQRRKLDSYRLLNEYARKGQILFTGSSLMEQFPVQELLWANGEDRIIYNRGVSGFTTTDMLHAMEEMVFELFPSRIFINIGTNDIGSPDYRLENLEINCRRILEQIRGRLSQTEVFVMAYYPVNETVIAMGMTPEEAAGQFVTRNNRNIRLANQMMEQLAGELGCRFIDVNEGLTDDQGRLRKEFTVEGIHLYPNAYRIVLENLRKYL